MGQPGEVDIEELARHLAEAIANMRARSQFAVWQFCQALDHDVDGGVLEIRAPERNKRPPEAAYRLEPPIPAPKG